MINKKKSRIKARLRKSKKDINKKIKDLFEWIKGAEIIELKNCEVEDDPVRPELDNEFRTSYGRKIYGVKYNNEIHAVMCIAFTKVKKTNHLNRLITLSPLTEMARKFHLNNGAEEVSVNDDTQNFEYKL